MGSSPLTFAVSSCALPGRSFDEIQGLVREHGWLVEFSSGFRPEKDLAEKFARMNEARLIHNYFPPPFTPFVLNLASLNPAIWKKSVDHALQGLRLAKAAGAAFYSIHAGFCIDPKTTQLGRRIPMPATPPRRDEHWKTFLKAITLLLREADKKKVDLLVENNVILPDNWPASGRPPFFCATPEEAGHFLDAFKGTRLGLLLDTAHLKVTAQTAGFDPRWFLRVVTPRVKALHHSDNDGTLDNNLPLTSNYWFLEHMPLVRSATHVLEVNDQTPEQIENQRKLLAGAL